MVRLLAALTGQKLRSIAMNSAMDTTEILGGFEQVSGNVRQINIFLMLFAVNLRIFEKPLIILCMPFNGSQIF